MNKLIIFVSSIFLLISISLIAPSKANAVQQCADATFGNGECSACLDTAYNLDCTTVSFFCSLNPFCDKYTGDACAAHENPPTWPGGSSCVGGHAPAPCLSGGGTFKVCWEVITPTPTPTPTPPQCTSAAGCPGCQDCIGNRCYDSNLFCNVNQTCTNAVCVDNPPPTPTPTPTPSVTQTPCQYGLCAPGQTQCLNGGKQTCELTTSGWCWSAPADCPANQSCTNGACVPSGGDPGSSCPAGSSPCTAQQANQGKTFCYDSTSYQTCVKYSDGPPPIYCKQFLTSCPAGQTCNVNSGNCQPGNPPTVTPTASPTPPPTFPPGCFIWQSCNGPGKWQTILTWPISFVQQNWCAVGSECVQTPGSGTTCMNQQCVDRGPVTISGSVFTDYNSNKVKDAAESNYSGGYDVNVSYTAGPYRSSSCPSTDYNTCRLHRGSDSFCQQCSTYPANPASSGSPQCNGGTYNSCISTCTSDPGSCPGVGPFYTAAQYCNANCTQTAATCCGGSYAVCSSWWCGSKTTCGTDCTGTFTPTPPPPALSTNKSGGLYTISNTSGGNLPYGTYTVSTTVTGATLTEPSSGNSFTVIAGSQQVCSTGSSVNASCWLGGIKNLNFGIKAYNPWIQSIGSDIRQDSGVSLQIPPNASCGSYASLPGSGGSPGIIYSGASNASFGSGQASAKNWIAGGASYPENYTPTRPNLIRTSYNYLLSVAKQAGITPTDISSYCGAGGINNCTLSGSLPNGLYVANGNLTLTGGGYTFPANKNFVILVAGNLNINEQIHVPNGSTATFSSSGNITVDKSVGESSQSSISSNVEGFYSADKNFIVDGNNSCSVGVDTRLNVAGAIIVNAALGGGTFQNNRNLCGGNNNCPAFSVAERPDFVLNAPEFIKHPSYTWYESAP